MVQSMGSAPFIGWVRSRHTVPRLATRHGEAVRDSSGIAPSSTTTRPPIYEMAQMRRAAGRDRSEQRVAQAEIAGMRELEDGDVRELARRDDAGMLEALQNACAVGAAPTHDLLDAQGSSALGGAMDVPGRVHFADHVGGFVGGRAVDRKRHVAAQRREPFRRRDARKSRQFDCGQCAMPVPVSASSRISSSSTCTRCASQTSRPR